MKKIIAICAISLFVSCNSSAQKKKTENYEVQKTEAEWKQELTAEEFYVLWEEGTERAFTSPLNNEKRTGTYHCAACDTPVFESEHKFDSGTGWPSFDRAIEGNVAYKADGNRTEEHCATCGGHLGHVFNDGPRATTGKRHCINGVALDFEPEK
ncbi:peptide-methionine (R)-S-oxide reductase MsrB [Sediminibacter sp. Hel_I_10]|uniref:peptide-methionine (R)-S-oxide reductase MsrB n=1 Tax=Sediminibacter sp. Hel_I_10 TaxID=1392490 RepID=UPI00047A3963|nr:peptide-methionine (R)-S-oxide reductase MsrB [Sediminibacter sp. Hel_I_10]